MTNQLRVMILDEEINGLVHNLNEYIQENEIKELYTVPPLEDGEFVEKYLQVYRMEFLHSIIWRVENDCCSFAKSCLTL